MSLDVKQMNEAKVGLPWFIIWKRRCSIALASVIFAVVLAYFWRGGDVVNAVLGMVTMIGLAMLILSVICGLLNWLFARKWPRDCTQASWAGISIVSFYALVIVFTTVFERLDYGSAMAYPEKVVPALEQYQRMHGKYPVTLAEISQLPSTPHGLVYFADENSYSFFYSSGGFFSGYDYSSETHQWKWADD